MQLQCTLTKGFRTPTGFNISFLAGKGHCVVIIPSLYNAENLGKVYFILVYFSCLYFG